MVKAPSEKTLDELAQDMHSRPEGLTHPMAKAEMEVRRTSAQLTCSWLAVSAGAAAITAGIAAYVAFPWRMSGA